MVDTRILELVAVVGKEATSRHGDTVLLTSAVRNSALRQVLVENGAVNQRQGDKESLAIFVQMFELNIADRHTQAKIMTESHICGNWKPTKISCSWMVPT